MTFRSLIVPALTAAAVVAGLAGAGTGSPKASTLPPIPLDEVRERGIVGRLGIRLGTIAEISGVVVANTSKAKGDENEPFFLKVTTVDDKPLREGVVFRYNGPPRQGDSPPEVGDRFHYMAYETGGYEGPPTGLYEYQLPIAQMGGYYFLTSLILLKEK